MMKIYSRTRTRRITITNWLAAVVLFFAGGAVAETTNVLSDAEIQGRQLARQLCEAKPVVNSTNTGELKIKNSKNQSTSITVRFTVCVAATNWQSSFAACEKPNDQFPIVEFIIKHSNSVIEEFISAKDINAGGDIGGFYCYTNMLTAPLRLGKDTAKPFAASDFWLCDLGLEFFHWPAQKILPHTTTLKRGREYTLLESTNPNPPTNGYSRVVSWIDKETGGILEAEAYDATGKLLKDFAPKSFKKVNGQWELQEMEIRNVQTGSRTRLEFDLPK